MKSHKHLHGKEVHSIMGCPCISFSSVVEAERLLVHIANEAIGGYSLAVNAEKVVRYVEQREFRSIATASILPIPDGAGALLALRLLYGEKSIKLDLPRLVLEVCHSQKLRLFVLGSREEANEAATAKIRRLYPNIVIAGRLDGYGDEKAMFEIVKEARPQVLLIALGSPKQERWAYKVQRELPGVLIVGCGGFLDVLAGKARRAPKVMVDNHLEWLYRFYRDPSRWRRYTALPRFACLLLLEMAKRKL